MASDFYGNFTLGILGGGQLGRMLIQAGIDWNLDIHVLDPDPNAPCSTIATHFVSGQLTDKNTVLSVGENCDIITIEIENVNTEALKILRDKGKKIFPQPEIIELIQDKRSQKQFYAQRGIPTAPFHLVENQEELLKFQNQLPFVNKLGREGYDGRGVQVLRTQADLEKGFDAPGIIEELIDFEKEVAVIVARNTQGEVIAYPAVEMVFHPEANLVEYLFSPARINAEIEEKAEAIAIKVINELDMYGILAVEMFITKSGEVLVNEVAPRPHNSGHHTIEANFTSQYQQHLRSILGLPLGNTKIRIPSAMVNLLGEDGHQGQAKIEGLEEVLSMEGCYVHLYGKKITKPFRKMGHITVMDTNADEVAAKAKKVKELLKIRA